MVSGCSPVLKFKGFCRTSYPRYLWKCLCIVSSCRLNSFDCSLPMPLSVFCYVVFLRVVWRAGVPLQAAAGASAHCQPSPSWTASAWATSWWAAAFCFRGRGTGGTWGSASRGGPTAPSSGLHLHPRVHCPSPRPHNIEFACAWAVAPGRP
jgi:hypothetical protein